MPKKDINNYMPKKFVLPPEQVILPAAAAKAPVLRGLKGIKNYEEKEISEFGGPNINCSSCKKAIIKADEVKTAYSLDLNNSFYICKNCFTNCVACESCKTTIYSPRQELQDGFCTACIVNAPVKVVNPYGLKVERNFKPLITKSKSSFLSKFARECYEDYDPSAFVFGCGEMHKKLFGIELEYETTNRYGSILLKASKLLTDLAREENGLKAQIKKDATLKDGFEIVSAPADKKSHSQIWGPLFDYLVAERDIVCTPYYFNPQTMERGMGCGCHIHISKDFLLNSNTYVTKDGKELSAGHGMSLFKLQTFIHHPNNRKFIELIAGRPSGMHFDFTKEKGAIFDPNGKIINKSVAKSRILEKDPHSVHSSHRTALNFIPSTDKTYEFRFFNATKDINKLLMYIDFVDALCSFCLIGNASLLHMADWRYFYKYVSNFRYDSPHLFKFLKQDSAMVNLVNSK